MRHCLEESVAGGVVEPRVVVRASHAGLQVQGLAGNLLGGELAGVGHPAGRGRVGVDRAAFLPRVEVLDLGRLAGVLDPLDDLRHGHEVDVVVVGEHLVDPVEEGVEELGVVLEPGGVVIKAERCAVLVVMTLEVVVEEGVELITCCD